MAIPRPTSGADFVRYKQVTTNMARAGVPVSWMTPLGLLKAAGVLGLLVGVVVPPIGIAAAVGFVLFFIYAIITHLRARFYSLTLPISFLALAVTALVLRLAASGGTKLQSRSRSTRV